MNAATVAASFIRTPRLDLVVLSPEFMAALIKNDREEAQSLVEFSLSDYFFPAQRDDMEFLNMRREQVRSDPAWAPWSLRAVVLREENAMIGIANFHGPPGVNDTSTSDAAEVGYDIFPEYRGAGFATEVARAMIDWAHDQHGVTHFISGVAPDNLPSLRINEKLGFVATGEIVDGELIFQLGLS